MVILYHASNKIIEKIENPEKKQIGLLKDFGYGFYCTKIQIQAIKWVERKYKFNGFVNEFFYDEERAKREVRVKVFKPDDEWLDFIIKNRTSVLECEFDIVEGPMADDQIYNHIDDLYDGIITREEFWKLAEFNYPTNQICFLTEKSITYLKFKGVKKYGKI